MHALGRGSSIARTFFSRDQKHQREQYNCNDLPAPQNSSLNNKALKNVGRRWYAYFVIKNKSLNRKRILLSFAEATQPFRPRPKILRFLLGLRRSSSCGRDCADGLLEAVCMATAFISRDPGLTGPQKSVGGAGATTPQPFRPRPPICDFRLTRGAVQLSPCPWLLRSSASPQLGPPCQKRAGSRNYTGEVSPNPDPRLPPGPQGAPGEIE